MCQKKPGPRCSAHGRARLETAQARLEQLQQDEASPEDRRAAAEGLEVAQGAFDATPAGQRALREALQEGADDGQADLLQRLHDGQRRRSEAVQAAARAAASAPTHHQGTASGTLGPATTTPSTQPTEGAASDHVADTEHAVPVRPAEQPADAAATRRVSPPSGVEPRPASGAADGDRAGVAGLSDRGSATDRLLIDGRSVHPVAVHHPPADEAAQLREQGRPTPTLYELDPADADVFHDSITALTSRSRFATSVHVYSEDEYRQMRLFTTADGRAGVALKGDDIVSVFSSPDGENVGCAPSLLATAVANGGRRLDCFDTVLPRLYASAGFVPVARLSWNDEYAPEGWDYDTYTQFNGGRPDVVFMAYDPDMVGSRYDPTAGQRIDDYDDGTAAASAAAKSPRTT
jgi:hypothetical protein